MKRIVIIVLTKKKENVIFESENSHFTLPKKEVVKNVKFFTSESAIDWLTRQPWDLSNERASIEEWLAVGEEKFLLSYTMVWEGRGAKSALEDLRDSRERRQKALEKELSNSFLV